MGLMKSLVEITHDEGYGDLLLIHINNAFGGRDMRAERVAGPVALSVKIEKPKRYRPFANAAEAEAMWDAVLKYKNPSPDREHSRYRIGFVSLGRVCIGLESYRYEEAFDVFECIDGTPFGVEVIDD